MGLHRKRVKPGEKLPASEVERRLNYLNRMARGELDSGSESESESSEEESDDDMEAQEHTFDGACGVCWVCWVCGVWCLGGVVMRCVCVCVCANRRHDA